MTTKQKSVLLSVLTLVLCLALVAGGTYALFTDQVTLKNHLEAGTMDITLYRVELKEYSLDANGFMSWKPVNTTREEFSGEENANKNVFDMEDGTLIVPRSAYTATMELSNGSDVAYGYWIEIVFDDSADLALADQIAVAVTADNGKTVRKMLNISNGLFLGSDTDPIDILPCTSGENVRNFDITVEFVDSVINNDAKGQSVSFDMVVHAVQWTTAP